MSVSGVSGAQPPFQPNPQETAFRSAIQSLTTAVGSGDLTSAQKAYASLTALQQGAGAAGAPPGGPKGGNDPFSQLLTKIGGDLSSGNISGAQSDLASFQKAAAGHHHRPPSGGPGPAADGDAGPAPAAAPTSTSSKSVDIKA